MNSKKQGDIGVAQAIAYYATLGWTVSIPLTDSQDYDIIVDDGSGLQRVQVKTSKNRGFGLRVLGGNQSWNRVAKTFDNTKIERVFLYRLSGESYDIPAKHVTQKSTISPDQVFLVGQKVRGEITAL